MTLITRRKKLIGKGVKLSMRVSEGGVDSRRGREREKRERIDVNLFAISTPAEILLPVVAR